MNPYRGLRAVGAEDAAYFIGREELTGELLHCIAASPDRVHVLIGNSGVGKSSVAKAGVLAALKSRLWPADWDTSWPDALANSHAWPMVELVPGESPIKALALAFVKTWLTSPADIEQEALKWRGLLMGESSLTALVQGTLTQLAQNTHAEAPDRIVLYIDQAEELYSRALPEEAARLSVLLAEAVARPELIAITSIRSDHYGRLQEDATLFAASDIHDVLPLTEEQIERVIRLPAERLKVRFDQPDMIPLMVKAAAREPGTTPMLSDLLADAWREMGNDLDADGVLHLPSDIIDISQPLAKKAERFVAAHATQERVLRRLLTIRLAHVPKKGEALRRRARRSECSDEEWALVELLAGKDWRLVTTGVESGEATAEVAHESLLRKWPRLVTWLDESSQFLIWKGQLEGDRRVYARAKEVDKPRALLSGIRLDTARYWLSREGSELDEDAKSFIETSINAANERRRLEHERNKRLLKQERLLTVQLHKSRIEQARAAALNAKNLALNGDFPGAIVLAVKAMPQANLDGWPAIHEIPEVPAALGQALFELKELARLRGHGSFVNSTAFNHDSSHVVTASFDQTARIWDVSSGQELRRLEGHVGVVNSAAFNHDGTRIVTASADQTVRIWAVSSGQELLRLDGHYREFCGATYNHDGSRIVTASDDETARIWDALNGQELLRLEGHEDMITSAAFNHDGSRVVTASFDQTARIWDASNGKELLRLEGHEDWVMWAAFNHNSTRVVTASEDQTTCIWNATSGQELLRFEGHENGVNCAAFSHDGARVVTVSGDQTTCIWDASSGRELLRLEGHEGQIKSVAFSHDSRQVVTASWDKTARIWDALSCQKQPPIDGHGDEVTSAAFNHDGSRVVTASFDQTARIWDASSGRELLRIGDHVGLVWSAAFNHDGSRVVTESGDQTARIWDASSGQELLRLEGHEGLVWSAAFNHDSSRIVTASEDGTARIWDASNGQELLRLEGHENDVTSAVFGRAGTCVVTSSHDRTARIWDASNGQELLRLEGHDDMITSAAFNHDGSHVVTASFDQTARIWDASSRQELCQLEGHENRVTIAAYNKDGSRIVTASEDGTARIWDALSGQELRRLEGHGGQVKSAAFNHDGTRIVTASSDQTARIWRTYNSYDDLYEAGTEVVNRLLGPDQ